MFLSFDESSELRAWGTALHVVYDAVWKRIIPSAPLGTSLNTDKPRGFLKLVYKERFYPILQIDSIDGGKTFFFVEKKGRFSPLKPPAYVTQDLLDIVKADVLKDPLFHGGTQ